MCNTLSYIQDPYLKSGRLLVWQQERPTCTLQMLPPLFATAVLPRSLRSQHNPTRVQHVSAGKRNIQLCSVVTLEGGNTAHTSVPVGECCFPLLFHISVQHQHLGLHPLSVVRRACHFQVLSWFSQIFQHVIHAQAVDLARAASARRSIVGGVLYPSGQLSVVGRHNAQQIE